MNFSRISCIALSSLSLIACGGSGGGDGENNSQRTISFSGVKTAATVDDSNKEALVKAAVLGSGKVISDDNNVPVYYGSSSSNGMSSPEMTRVIVDESEFFCESGSSFINYVDLSLEQITAIDNGLAPPPNSGRFIQTNDNCSYGGGVTNGTIDLSWSGGFDDDTPRNFTAIYNFSFNEYPFSGTMTCSNFVASCSLSSSFSSEDGVDYYIDLTDVDNVDQDTYNLSTNVYHEEYGYTTITGTNLDFHENGSVCSGSISVVDTTGQEALLIEFTGCNTGDFTFEGDSIEFSIDT